MSAETVTALVTMSDDFGLVVTLHRDEDDAFATLASVLIDMRELDPEDRGNHEAIRIAADATPQFTWDVTEVEVP